MIQFELIPAKLEATFTAKCLFVIPGLNDQYIEVTGKPEEIRIALRDHYYMHLQLLVDRFIGHSPDNGSPIYGWSLAQIREAQKAHIKVGKQWSNQFPDHVSMAKELEPLTDELTALLPIEYSEPAKKLYDNLLSTIEQLANNEASLWVRGSIEMLSGEIVHTWMDQNEAA